MFSIHDTHATNHDLFLPPLLPEWLAVGLLAYGISTIVYFYVLSRVHLSWAYTIGGMGYVIAIVLAAVVLGEPVSALRWAGILVITLGVVLIGLS